ncbi:MAG: TonB-dependent receptor, partial [Bacteroidetes bacterium]|nr:TonB-dependent receptor [Bacteroidota bacterium]
MIRFFFIAALLSFVFSGLNAQNKTSHLNRFTINGYIKDSLSGESIIGASIIINGKSAGITSNQYGFYSITLDSGTYVFSISHISYLSTSVLLALDSSLTFNFTMLPKSSALEDVVIFSKRRDGNVKNAQMGKIDLSIQRIRSIPALLGEVDILKAIQLLPGIQSAGEGNAGFYVRGGGPDQNLIMLDDAVVYNTGHLFGFFSIFNSDAIKNVSLVKGGMPAQYGGRLSSVLDISMKDGNL